MGYQVRVSNLGIKGQVYIMEDHLHPESDFWRVDWSDLQHGRTARKPTPPTDAFIVLVHPDDERVVRDRLAIVGEHTDLRNVREQLELALSSRRTDL